MRFRGAVLAGVAAALLLIAITTYRLERPGAEFDELHQAPAAFAYVGRPSTMFSFVPIGGLPLMNMSYTGAIKSAVYGVYLRLSGRPFSLWSWRLLGILFCAAGLLAFCLLTAGRLPTAAIALFLGLLMSDTSFLLLARHDWGPVALGFLLRMILIGLGIRYLTGAHRPWSAFVLGLITGVAIFEKLSSGVLLGPLAIVLLADPAARRVRAALQAAAGVAIGALPMIAVNLYSLVMTNSVVALSAFDPTPRRSIAGYAANFLVLGNGGLERRMIFELPAVRWTEVTEGVAIAGLLLLAGSVAWQQRRRVDGPARLAGVALACYLAVGAALPLLPHGTAQHHWILGTPFQYLAIALAAAPLWSARPLGAAGRPLLIAALALLAAARLPAIRSVVDATRGDHYTKGWDPSLNAAAAFAARQPEGTIYIAANWGTGTQVLCASNGRQNFVFELYPVYGGPRDTLNPVLAPPDRRVVVAAAIRQAPRRPGEINTVQDVTANIFRDLSAAPDWEEVPVDPEIAALRAVEIRMYRRKPHA